MEKGVWILVLLVFIGVGFNVALAQQNQTNKSLAIEKPKQASVPTEKTNISKPSSKEENSKEVWENESAKIKTDNESVEVLKTNNSFEALPPKINNESFNFSRKDAENRSGAANNTEKNESGEFLSNYSFVNLDDLINKSEKNESKNDNVSVVESPKKRGESEEKKEVKKIKKSLVKDGKIEVEFEIFENESIDISKKEIEANGEKVVRVSSPKHFERPVRVYSDLPRPVKKEDIRILWENEKNKIVEDVLYIDEDSDGLVERVSWIVPHLSTQYYRIIIKTRDGGDSSSLGLKILSPSNESVVENPVKFEIEINYTNKSLVNCSLKIDGKSYAFNFSGKNDSHYFSEGSHSFSVFCFDSSKPSISASESGNFRVEDRFKLDVEPFSFVGFPLKGSVSANGGVVSIFLEKIGGEKKFVKNISGNFPQNFEINKSLRGSVGKYRVIAVSDYFDRPARLEKNVSVGSASVSFDNEVEVGSSVEFSVNIDSEGSGSYDFYVGNERVKNNVAFNGKTQSKISKKMDSGGSFKVSLEVFVGGEKYVFDFGSISVKETQDKKNPEVELLFPEWEDVVNTRDITFRYKASDNVFLSNCSLELYNATKGSSGVYKTDTLIFPLNAQDKNLAFKSKPKNNEEVSVKILNFDAGDYIWEVKCFDNSSNKGWNFNYFRVDFGNSSTTSFEKDSGENYSREAEVRDLIKKVNGFLEKENNYGAVEREVLEKMGISKDMALYKKRLVQIDQDFRFNLRFLDDAKKRKRIEELNKEIDEIKSKIVLGISVKDDYEFSKNSLDMSLEDILSRYLELTGTSIKRSALRSLVESNKELQSKLRTKVKSRKVSIQYLDHKKDIVLVEKSFDLNDESVKTLFEVLPEDVGSAVFLVNGKKVGGGIYEFNLDELKNKEIVYYFEDNFDLKKIEKTESVLFSEEVSDSGFSITGMFSGIGDSIDIYSFFFLFLVACMGYFGFFVFEKVRLELWKRDLNVEMIIDLIGQAREHLRRDELEYAKEKYQKMKELYPRLPRKCKPFFYKEIRKILLSINKKDAFRLLREYERAKEEFRKEDALAIHKKLSEIYKKLPQKYRDRIYQRIVKGEI
ncbi:hypothetical protein D6829_00490 [Candidatus Pacearchaeota archaeon]|nr:MAG: hypothetical protein D6829_00490 [Candidatus Pacearchaeota archaeon]